LVQPPDQPHHHVLKDILRLVRQQVFAPRPANDDIIVEPIEIVPSDLVIILHAQQHGVPRRQLADVTRWSIAVSTHGDSWKVIGRIFHSSYRQQVYSTTTS